MRTRTPVPGIGEHQRLLPVGEPELCAERGIGHRHLMRARERPHEPVDAAGERAHLLRREEAGPEHRAERPVAEDHLPPAELVLQHHVRGLSDIALGEEVVVDPDRAVHGRREEAKSAAHPACATWRRPPLASRMTMSAMWVTTQSK